jgi:hypothetical protein
MRRFWYVRPRFPVLAFFTIYRFYDKLWPLCIIITQALGEVHFHTSLRTPPFTTFRRLPHVSYPPRVRL